MRSESAAGQDRRPSEKPRLRLRIRLWQLAGGRRRRRMRINPAPLMGSTGGSLSGVSGVARETFVVRARP